MMKKSRTAGMLAAITACMILLMGCNAAPAAQVEVNPAELSVTYLGNEGFLVSVGEQSVLIDALQGPGLEGYAAMPEADRDAMERAAAPFNTVDLVLATHHHPDHFNVGSVARFLKANPQAHLISTPEAVRRLSQGTEFGERLIALAPTVGNPVKHRVQGIEIEAFRLHHGRGRDIDNFGYLVTMGNQRWFHVGDAMVTAEEMSVERVQERDVDLYFVPYWQLLNDDRQARLAAVGAAEVIAMHLPSAAAPASWLDPFSDRDVLLRELRESREAEPKVHVLDRVGESRLFGATRRDR